VTFTFTYITSVSQLVRDLWIALRLTNYVSYCSLDSYQYTDRTATAISTLSGQLQLSVHCPDSYSYQYIDCPDSYSYQYTVRTATAISTLTVRTATAISKLSGQLQLSVH